MPGLLFEFQAWSTWKWREIIIEFFIHVYIWNFKTELIRNESANNSRYDVKYSESSTLKWVIKREMISEIVSRVYYFVYGRHCKYFLITIIYVEKNYNGVIARAAYARRFFLYFILFYFSSEMRFFIKIYRRYIIASCPNFEWNYPPTNFLASSFSPFFSLGRR